MSVRRALITGITGQDGCYLVELLLDRGYVVNGMVRPASRLAAERQFQQTFRRGDQRSLAAPLRLHSADLADDRAIRQTVEDVEPHEVYHLAAQSSVRDSFDRPAETLDVVAAGTVRLLEAVRRYEERSGRRVRVFQAGSSEVFAAGSEPLHEESPVAPQNPYGVAKLAAWKAAAVYREAYGMHVSCGLLFNHESPRRPETFVTRKVTAGVARIKLGLQSKLSLGNLAARRDWGYAGDFVRAMWLMLQQETPGDYVIATGTAHSVRDLVQAAFDAVGLEAARYLETAPEFCRPVDAAVRIGDAAKARRCLNWEPEVTFSQLIQMMVAADLQRTGCPASDGESGLHAA